MEQIILWGALFCGFATCLLAGVFLAFSDFIMRSLNAASRAAAAEVMQLINRKIYRSVFMLLFMGMVPVSLATGAGALTGEGGPWTALAGAAAAYIFGVFGVTALGNVPLNNRLDRMELGGPDAQNFWPNYARPWLRYNHIRTVFCVVTSVCFFRAAFEVAAG